MSDSSLSFDSQQLSGGVIRVSTGPSRADSSPVSVPPPTRVVNGSLRFNADGTAESFGGVARHVVSFDGVPGGSVMATRQRVNGQDTVELQPGIPGTRTVISQALRDNLIREIAPGVFEDATAAGDIQHTAQPQAQGPEQQPEVPAYIDTEDEALWAEDIAPLPQHSYDAASASAIAAILQGESFEGTTRRLAESAQLTPELAADFVNEGYAKGRRMVDRALAPLGLSGDRLEQFYEAARERPQELQEAMQRVWYANDASGFQAMATAWKVQNPGNLSVFRNGGFETHVDRESGDLMLRRPGGSWVRAADLSK